MMEGEGEKQMIDPELICTDGAGIIRYGLSMMREEEKKMCLLPKSVRQVHGTNTGTERPSGGRRDTETTENDDKI